MERRRHQRAPLVREAVAYFGNTEAPCRTIDVSSGGIALALPTAQRAGQFVRISWAFASGLWVDADAVIVRVDRRYAEWVHGTSFLNIEAVIARQIEEFVKQSDLAATPSMSGAWRRVGSISDLPATRAPTHGTTPIVPGVIPIVRPAPPERRQATVQMHGTTPPAHGTTPPGRRTTPPVRFTPPPSRVMPAPVTSPPSVRSTTPPVRGMTPQSFRSPSSPAVPSHSMTPSRPPAEGTPSRPTGRPSQALPAARTPAQAGAGDFAGTLIPRNKDELRQLYEDALREVDGVTRKPDKR